MILGASAKRQFWGDSSLRGMHCFCYFCLLLSLPWATWFTGWIGVLLHLQAAAGLAWLIEKISPKARTCRPTR